MTQIFSYINYDKINHVDDYEGSIKLHKFTNVLFRTQVSSLLRFQTPLGVTTDNKIISITNRQLSFLVIKSNHFLGENYAVDLKNTYENISANNYNEQIDDEVFLFFDYESVNGTGHSYDLMFYLLYIYKLNNLNCKLLVVESNNIYYNLLLGLIKKYFNIEYLYIKQNQNYLFTIFNCVRTYQNVFFHQVKEFINDNLINPIIKKYDNLNTIFYENIIKLKFYNSSQLNRDNDSFEINDAYLDFCDKNRIFDLNNVIDNEELKIYYINKAKTIIVQFSSIYYININYYLANTENKKIIVLVKHIHNNQPFIQQVGSNLLKQNMPGNFCGNITDQLYNTWKFKGELINNIETIDDIVSMTNV
jgi:hypothetical protein